MIKSTEESKLRELQGNGWDRVTVHVCLAAESQDGGWGLGAGIVAENKVRISRLGPIMKHLHNKLRRKTLSFQCNRDPSWVFKSENDMIRSVFEETRQHYRGWLGEGKPEIDKQLS